MAGYSYHHWQDDDGRDGLIDFEQYYTFPSRSKSHAGGQGILHRLLKRQYRHVDDTCQYAKKKQQLASQSSKSLSKSRQWGTDQRSDQSCQAPASPTTPATMRAFSSNNLKARHKQCNPDQQSSRQSAPSASPATTNTDQQPGIFSRLLRRAQSKRTLKSTKSNTAEELHTVSPLPAGKEPRKDAAAQGEDSQRTATAERKPTLRLRKSIRQRFRGAEQLPRQPEATETKTAPAAVYVPRHAAADFSRTADPNPEAAARFASFDQVRRHPSSSSQHARGSLTLQRPRTSPGDPHKPNDDGCFQQQQQLQVPRQPQQNDSVKRRSWAGSNTESRSNRFSFASHNAESDYTAAAPPNAAAAAAPAVDDDDDEAPLQPSNADQAEPRPRQNKRHSYRLVPDPHDAVIEEETDFQQFLHQAVEEDRRRDAEHDLQFLLGGTEWNSKQPQQLPSMDRSNKRASESHRKRASMVSYRSQTDRTKQQQQQQQRQRQDSEIPDLTSADLKVKRKPSVSKRVQGYFKPDAVTNLRD
ncbi:hypothetical protein PG994_000142 [Apiospora phragmitis]|uniref:Uncharacterized protein n=1 Tax=Apiospora phragmitis TaxID=2905665 RepID=A0ABR1X5I1_9PEZI